MSLVRAGRRPDATHRLPTLTFGHVVLAMALMAAIAGSLPSAALGAARSSSDVEELWREYPLEQTPTTEGPAARPSADAAAPAGGRASAPEDRPTAGSGVWTVVLLAAAGVLLLIAVLSLVTSRRKRRRASPSEPPLLGGAAPASERPGVADAAQPRFERDAGAVQREPTAPAANRSGPVCQIRWLAHGRRSCFVAFIRDANGAEQRVARSPRVEQLGASPPVETPEAKAALRKLAKELRDDGWKPLRAKGKDYGEQQWYTRRFRRLAEPAPTGDPEGKRNVGSW